MKPTIFETLTSFAAQRGWPTTRETTVYDCALVELPRIESRSGNITVVQSGWNCPIPIRRVYYLYDVPAGASRGGHAHIALHQFLVAASGSFEVLIDDGRNRRTLLLNRPHLALHLVPGIWRELHNFSSGSICLVLASTLYDESDYVRNYPDFRTLKSLESYA